MPQSERNFDLIQHNGKVAKEVLCQARSALLQA